MLMKYILLLHKKYLNNLIFIYVNIFIFWLSSRFYIFPMKELIFSPKPYAEVNFHPKTLRRG